MDKEKNHKPKETTDVEFYGCLVGIILGFLVFIQLNYIWKLTIFFGVLGGCTVVEDVRRLNRNQEDKGVSPEVEAANNPSLDNSRKILQHKCETDREKWCQAVIALKSGISMSKFIKEWWGYEGARFTRKGLPEWDRLCDLFGDIETAAGLPPKRIEKRMSVTGSNTTSN